MTHSLSTMHQQPNYFDFLILGAGPAGLQLSYYMEKHGQNYLVLDKGKHAGSYFQNFPRHRKLISINKLYTGTDDPELQMRWDWNSLLTDDYSHRFRDYSEEYFPNADHLVSYLNDFAGKYIRSIRYETEIVRIDKRDGLFFLQSSKGDTYISKYLIVATGYGKPHVPNIPGIELSTQYIDMSIEGKDFANKDVLVIGKGNSGFETADHLTPYTASIHIVSPKSVMMAWKSHFVGNLRAVNNNFLDTYQLKSQNAVIDAEISQIRKTDSDKYAVDMAYTHARGENETLYYDEVISCTGFAFDSQIFSEECTPELCIDNRFPSQTECFEIQ